MISIAGIGLPGGPLPLAVGDGVDGRPQRHFFPPALPRQLRHLPKLLAVLAGYPGSNDAGGRWVALSFLITLPSCGPKWLSQMVNVVC